MVPRRANSCKFSHVTAYVCVCVWGGVACLKRLVWLLLCVNFFLSFVLFLHEGICRAMYFNVQTNLKRITKTLTAVMHATRHIPASSLE